MTEALGRRGIEGKVVRPKWAERSRLGLYSISFPDHGPRVAVLIPTRDRVDLLRPCVESVVAKTAYTNYEVVIIDNGSKDPATLRYMDQCGHRVLRIPQDRFNFAALNNEAAEQVDCEYLLFLNNDTRVLSREWLNQMSGFGGSPVSARSGPGFFFLTERFSMRESLAVYTTVWPGQRSSCYRLTILGTSGTPT